MSCHPSRRTALRGSVAASLGLMAGVALTQAASTLSANDRRLVAIAAELVVLQAQADRLAPHAELEAYDPYTETVAQMDHLGEEAARLAADTMDGVLAKLRALAVPIIGDEGENAGPGNLIGRSVCRDVERIVGILQPATAQVSHGR